MSIKHILNVSCREVRSIIHDRLYLSVLLILPMVMITFFAIMFYRGTIEGLPIAVVDSDKSAMSRKLITMLSATRGVDITAEISSIDDAEALMLSSKVYAILFIEDGFEADIYRGVPTRVECYIPGTNMSASGVIERDVEQVVRTLSAGVAISKLVSGGASEYEAMLEVMPINFQTNILFNPYLNYGYYLVPIFMFMGIVIFVVLSTIYAVGRELRYATAPQWLESSNGSLAVALIGKLLPIFVIMLFMSMLVCVVLFIVMGMECAGNYVVLALTICMFIAAYQSVGIAIISVASNLRLGLSLGGGYAVMAFTFSGITFPTLAMYALPRALSYLFPLTYFSNIFVDEVMFGAPLRYTMWEYAPLALFLLLTPIVWRRLQHITTTEEYWRRD